MALCNCLGVQPSAWHDVAQARHRKGRAMRAILMAGFTAGASLALSVPVVAQTPPPPATQAAKPPPPLNIRTTADLVALCDTPETDPDYPGAIGLCVGYGSGVLDYHLADTAQRRRARRVCVPTPAPTRGAARTLFIAWAHQHPQYMNAPAVDGVMRFLMTTYPCRK